MEWPGGRVRGQRSWRLRIIQTAGGNNWHLSLARSLSRTGREAGRRKSQLEHHHGQMSDFCPAAIRCDNSSAESSTSSLPYRSSSLRSAMQLLGLVTAWDCSLSLSLSECLFICPDFKHWLQVPTCRWLYYCANCIRLLRT